MKPKPFISVIVPTYHRNDLLAACLDRLTPGAQTLSAEQYEVIVTDDGSQTMAEQMVRERYAWARWVRGPGKGPAANRNNGARIARGLWLAFLDDDCLPDSQWLKSYAEAIAAESGYLVFEGRTYVDQPRRTLAEYSPLNETGGYLWSCNFSVKKSVFESLSGFDERFPYAAMEDVDLRTRLLKAGHRFLFIRDASVCHPWRERGDWKSLKRSQKSYLIYLSLHPEELETVGVLRRCRDIFSVMVKDTVPGVVKFRGRGFWKALMVHIENMQCTALIVRQRSKKLEQIDND